MSGKGGGGGGGGGAVDGTNNPPIHLETKWYMYLHVKSNILDWYTSYTHRYCTVPAGCICNNYIAFSIKTIHLGLPGFRKPKSVIFSILIPSVRIVKKHFVMRHYTCNKIFIQLLLRIQIKNRYYAVA